MRILVINLDIAKERLAFQARQMGALGLTLERLAAVSSDKLSTGIPETYWHRWERPLSPAEKACFLSHRYAWQTVTGSKEPTLILEDDAVLSRRVPALLNAVANRQDIDHLTLEVRRRKKIISRNIEHVLPDVGLRRLYQDRSGAAAYILWPEGGRKLLARTEKASALADAAICAAYELCSFQTDPACAVQIDLCADYRLPVPIATKSFITPAQPETHRGKGNVSFRLRRLQSQIHMGLRQLSRLPVSERREIALTPEDFRGVPILEGG